MSFLKSSDLFSNPASLRVTEDYSNIYHTDKINLNTYFFREDEIDNNLNYDFSGLRCSLSEKVSFLANSFVCYNSDYYPIGEPLTVCKYINQFLDLSVELFDDSVLVKDKFISYINVMLKLGFKPGQIIYSIIKDEVNSLNTPVYELGDFIEEIFSRTSEVLEMDLYYKSIYYKMASSDYATIVNLFDLYFY